MDQSHHTDPSHSTRRRWKPDRPNYRALLTTLRPAANADATSSSATSRLQNAASKQSVAQLDPEQLEADLEEWGLPSTSASSSLPAIPRLAAPVSAISWDENSAQVSCSYLQSPSSAGTAAHASLDQWDPSISFAPYSCSGLEPIQLQPRSQSNEGAESARTPFRYDPGLGRVVAVGRDDGTVIMYRAYGRTEDYESLSSANQPSIDADDTLPASASASANLSHHVSTSASRRSTMVSNRALLRSPDTESPSIRLPSITMAKSASSSGREPSPLLATFSPTDRSPLTACSIVSTASVSSAAAANVQLDEGVPAGSLQSNVTATGHTAGRNYLDQAENRLELQIAAAERNDHQHGVVGGVIERLGFGSHSPTPHHHHHSSSQSQSRQPYHRTRSNESRSSPVTPPKPASPFQSSAAEAQHAAEAQLTSLQPAAPISVETSIKPSAPDAWLQDPSRGTFAQVMTLYTRDRSPVVALRLIPLPSATSNDSQNTADASFVSQPTQDKAALLVVQEAGNISLWSLLEGSMIWQLDVTMALVVTTASESNDQAAKDGSISLSMMQSLRGQLPASIGTPLTRSPAGSARASPRPMMTGGDASLRRSMLRSALSGPDAATGSRLNDAHGVKLDSHVQTLQTHGSPIALLWDSHSSSVLVLDLTDGRLMLHQYIDDVHPANKPTLRHQKGSQEKLELFWFSETEVKLQTRPLRIVSFGSTVSQEATDESRSVTRVQGIVLEEAASADSASSQHWVLSSPPDSMVALYLTVDHVLVLEKERVSVLDRATGKIECTQEATSDSFKRLCGASHDSLHLLIQTATGMSRLDLAEQPGTQKYSERGSSQMSLRPVVSHSPPARLFLPWNLPESGALLDKVFLLQPLPSEGLGKDSTTTPSSVQSELAALDLLNSETEDLLSASRSHSPPDPLQLKDAAAHICSERSTHAERVTALLPLSLERIAVASSGGLQVFSLSALAAGQAQQLTTSRGDATKLLPASNSLGQDHEICLLRSAVAPRAGHRLIIGGTYQGEVAFWTASAPTDQGSGSPFVPQLEAKLSISTSPVGALKVFGDDDNTIRLHGCVACICADSSVTFVLLEGFRQLYSVPGRGARLTSLAVRADELLLTYDDDKARVWDLRSQELRRSIATDQAQALIEDGKGWWTVKTVEPYSPLHSGTTGVLSQLAAARDDAAAALLVDFRRAIEAAARSVRGPSQSAANDATAQLPSSQAQRASHSGTTTTAALQPSATLRSEQDLDGNSGPSHVGIASPAARKAVNIIRPLLPTLFPVGLDASIDAKLAALLDLDESVSASTQSGSKGHSAFTVGLHSAPDALMVGGSEATNPNAKRVWTLSSRLTTIRLVTASALLRVLSHVSELRGLTEELQRFVEDEARLSTLVEVGFRTVTLNELVPYWLDTNTELRNASRSIFQSALARLEQDQLDDMCRQWQNRLVSSKSAKDLSNARGGSAASGADSEAELQTRALALLGSIAVERYTCLSPRLLKDIASTIHSAITTDKGSEMRTAHDLQMLAVAIELCRNGFSIWQHYLDATEVVRSLFALSTSTSAGSGKDGELRALARSATLQIAAENTPLFMTTLSLDILHARSPAHCSATMRLVAFMVRKRPSVLVASLPRLAEAVVKSLDPTHTTMREAVVNAATVMISELVSTYPSVSFFGGGQRLAVGTQEGAVIMYDLKTATRLYVLEGHRRRADAVSFSPDGRRLVTMSLEEGRVLVWKTSSGFTSFFSPGQMPRQGAADVKLTDGAYKAFHFNVGAQQQGTLSRQASLADLKAGAGPASNGGAGEGQEEDFVGFDKIGFHWNSERSVKVQIGEAQLNISVE